MIRVFLAILLFAFAAASPAVAEERHALLIGNKAYDAKLGALQNPLNDIAVVGQALEKLSFRITRVPDADYRAVDTAIKRHVQAVRRAGPGAISFVYYSGHGAADPETKINYLIPIDVKSTDSDEVWTNSLNLNEIVESLRKQAPQATHFVVFDACRAELNLTRTGAKAPVEKGLTPIPNVPGVLVAYATAPGMTATDHGSGSGTYAKALAEEIVRPGVEVVTVFRNIGLRVLKEVGQNPWLGGVSTFPAIYLAGEKVAVATEPAKPATPPTLTYRGYIDAFERRQPVVTGKQFQRSELGPLASSILESIANRLKGTVWDGGDNWERIAFDATGFMASYGSSAIEGPGRILITGVLGDQGQGARTRSVALDPIAVGEWSQANGSGGFILRFTGEGVSVVWGPGLFRESRWVTNAALTAPKLATTANGDPLLALTPGSGHSARDRLANGQPCAACPEMVAVPSGEFMMGSDESDREKPIYQVTIAKPFAVGKFTVTFDEWDACVAAKACARKPEDRGWGRGKRPVINVSWDEVTKEYLPWLSKISGKAFRLLTEAEWEYAARGVTSASAPSTRYPWGNDIGKNNANCDGCGSQWDKKQTAPVGSFKANAFGLYDMHGNVWQWVQDCWKPNYAENAVEDCSRRVVRGCSWDYDPQFVRSTFRYWGLPGIRGDNFGFRVARSLTP